MSLSKNLFLYICILTVSNLAHAKKPGTFSIGANVGISATDQKDMNTLIKRANTRESGLGVSELGNAWDINLMLTYRATKMIALQLRPGFFFVSEDGSSGSGSYEYDVTGFSIFPVVRVYMLENKMIGFYSNFSVGWGYASGTVKEGPSKVEFGGGDLGYMLGLGAEFCFFGGMHCMNIEGNLRYLSIDRVIASSSSGTFASDSLTQSAKSNEVEINGRDLGLTQSGLVGLIGYIYYFK